MISRSCDRTTTATNFGAVPGAKLRVSWPRPAAFLLRMRRHGDTGHRDRESVCHEKTSIHVDRHTDTGTQTGTQAHQELEIVVPAELEIVVQAECAYRNSREAPSLGLRV